MFHNVSLVELVHYMDVAFLYHNAGAQLCWSYSHSELGVCIDSYTYTSPCKYIVVIILMYSCLGVPRLDLVVVLIIAQLCTYTHYIRGGVVHRWWKQGGHGPS